MTPSRTDDRRLDLGWEWDIKFVERCRGEAMWTPAAGLPRPRLVSYRYGWFTEGFDTLDLKEAKGLLDELVA